MSAGSFLFAAMVAGCASALALAVLAKARDLRVVGWMAGATRGAVASLKEGTARGLASAALVALGGVQESYPALKAFSARLHARAAPWLGAADPGTAGWLALKEACGLAAGLLFGWLLADAALGIVAGAGAFFLPDLLAKGAYDKRQEEIGRELPDVLDLMTIALEAGMSLDAAFKVVADKYSGRLPDAIILMLGEVRFGARRHAAWKDMAVRLGNPELNEVVAALVQADAMGVGLAGSLKGLAGQMRVRRRQRVEEAAHKAPVKLLFPLALFIFPAIFLVLLGPVALQLMEAMK